MGGTDNLKTSIGHGWAQGPINAPTVLNSSLNVAQFWDGRAKDLKEQAGGPIANPGEMASNHQLATHVLQSIPGYVREFKLVFGDGKIDIDRVTSAIAEFEKTLVTPYSRFDLWLLGKKDALNEQEKAGYTLFKQAGCVACHNGPTVGGNSFQKMGVVQPYKSKSDAVGLAAVTGKDADRFKFKVPTLRNVELTYPYFHDGEAETLTEAVDIMGRLQLGKKFTDDENARIVAFLRCPPWRAKRRRVVPGSREATRDTRRAEGAKGDPKGASERGVQSYGRPVCSRNELAMLWRNAG